jgi:hypothetical protein
MPFHGWLVCCSQTHDAPSQFWQKLPRKVAGANVDGDAKNAGDEHDEAEAQMDHGIFLWGKMRNPPRR